MTDPGPAHPQTCVLPAAGPWVRLRRLAAADEQELLARNHASVALHHPWIAPPTTHEQSGALLERSARADMACLLICRSGSGEIVGAVNFSQIVYGALCSAYLGYYVVAPFVGHGFMREGVGQALWFAFESLTLHRVEANVQPGNTASRALVQRLGFTLEGFSRRYLYVDGDWRDHERYALLVEDWRDRRA